MFFFHQLRSEGKEEQQDPIGLFLLKIYFYLFIYLAASGLTCSMQGSSIFLASCRVFSCSMWNLGPWPGTRLGPPHLGAWSLSHWTTRQVPKIP